MTRVQVNGDRLSPNRIKAGTNGSYHETVYFEFSSEWTGLHCKAVFYPVRGKPVEVVWAGKAIKIPPEVMRYSGDAKYVVSGFTVAADGTLEEKIITLPGIVEVDATLKDEGGESVKQTPAVYEQLHANMKEDIAEAIEDAVAAEPDRFRGETGEAATITVVGTTTLAPGNLAEVVNQSPEDPQNPRLWFKIPRGATGDPGVMLLGEGESIEDADIPEDVSVVIIPTGKSLEVVDGKDGEGFRILGFFGSVDGLDDVFPQPGDAYGIGETAPYDIYVFDGNTMTWRNIGAMNGIKGEPGVDGRGVASIVYRDGSGTEEDPYRFWIRYTDGTQSEFPAVLTNGKDGRGISSVSLVDNTTGVSGKPGTTDTYEIKYTDGTTFRFSVYNGRDGDGADITVSDTVTADGVDAVNGKAVYGYIASVIGDFDSEAAEMDALIGGAV